MTWQPIETAPKDGTAILVYGAIPMMLGAQNPYGGAPSEVGVVRWKVREYEDFEPAESGMYRKVMRGGGGWEGALGSLNTSIRPTHWRPLPEPPEAQK